MGFVAADVYRSYAFAQFARYTVFGVVDDGNQRFRGFAFQCVIDNIDAVIGFAFMVAEFNAEGLHIVFINIQAFDGIAANGKFTRYVAFEIAELGIGHQLDGGIAVVDDFVGKVVSVAIVFFQSEIRILHDGITLNPHIIHYKLAVIYADAVQTVAVGLVVGNGNVVAVVDVQPFSVVVVGFIIGKSDAVIITARHGSNAVAGAAVGFMTVAF